VEASERSGGFRCKKSEHFTKSMKTFIIRQFSDQIEAKITFKGDNNSLKVHKNYFCNGTRKSIILLKKLAQESNHYNFKVKGKNFCNLTVLRNKYKTKPGKIWRWSVRMHPEKKSEMIQKRRLGFLSTCSALLLISLFIFPVFAENTSNLSINKISDKISPNLYFKMSLVSSNKKIPVIIQLNNQSHRFNTLEGKVKIDSEQKSLLNFLNDSISSGKAQKIKSIHIVNAVAAEVTPDIITSIATRTNVLTIEPDDNVSIAEGQIIPISTINASNSIQNDAWGIDKIEAPAVWQKGITGKGVTVAVVDTGIDATHPDLRYITDTNDTKVIGWIDYINGINSPYDDNGHGTHIAGTI